MKTIFISFITAFALTSAATAHTWMWFRGDIGVGSSPFVTSGPAKRQATAPATTKKSSVATRAAARPKSKVTDQRVVTAR
jgi:hypothetical protein